MGSAAKASLHPHTPDLVFLAIRSQNSVSPAQLAQNLLLMLSKSLLCLVPALLLPPQVPGGWMSPQGHHCHSVTHAGLSLILPHRFQPVPRHIPLQPRPRTPPLAFRQGLLPCLSFWSPSCPLQATPGSISIPGMLSLCRRLNSTSEHSPIPPVVLLCTTAPGGNSTGNHRGWKIPSSQSKDMPCFPNPCMGSISAPLLWPLE